MRPGAPRRGIFLQIQIVSPVFFENFEHLQLAKASVPIRNGEKHVGHSTAAEFSHKSILAKGYTLSRHERFYTMTLGQLPIEQNRLPTRVHRTGERLGSAAQAECITAKRAEPKPIGCSKSPAPARNLHTKHVSSAPHTNHHCNTKEPIPARTLYKNVHQTVERKAPTNNF